MQQHQCQHHLHPHGSANVRTTHPSSPLAFLPKNKALCQAALHNSVHNQEEPQQPGFPQFSPKPSLPCAIQPLVSHSLKSSIGNLCRREQGAEGEGGRGGIISTGKSSMMSKQNKATDKAGFHNRPFTVQEIMFLMEKTKKGSQLALLSTRRGLTAS